MDAFAVDDTGRNLLDFTAGFSFNRPFAVKRSTQRINHPANQLGSSHRSSKRR